MLTSAFSRLLANRNFLFLTRKAAYIRGFWPEPITQTSLEQFLKDVNYYEDPTNFSNIGFNLEKEKTMSKLKKEKSIDRDQKTPDIDAILESLAVDSEPPPLDLNDAIMNPAMLTNLAVSDGIYRDLFTDYKPDREYTYFTREQAEKMDRLIPYFWITDALQSRVKKTEKPTPLPIFKPYVYIYASFISQTSEQSREEEFAYKSYHGNIIPACQALQKPSITLDGALLGGKATDLNSGQTNWNQGSINLVNFKNCPDKLYTIVLLNLDHLHENAANLHWMIANISPNSTAQQNYEEFCDFLPVHGIQGFGYSRYVFLALQHEDVLKNNYNTKDYSLQSRRFNMSSFLEENKDINLTPVGLSWFQTAWDQSSNEIFHNWLKIKAPVYDYVHPKPEGRKFEPYPGRIPFHLYLDHTRDKKEINEQVLLERLRKIDPTSSYKDQYVPPKVPPTIHQDELSQPHWMKSTIFKKHNKIGYWRGLRPASALLPLDNNVDLDNPIRPLAPASKTPPGEPNEYPHSIKYRPFKNLPHSKPADEHDAVYIQDSHEVHLEKAYQLMEEFRSKEKVEKAKTVR